MLSDSRLLQSRPLLLIHGMIIIIEHYFIRKMMTTQSVRFMCTDASFADVATRSMNNYNY